MPSPSRSQYSRCATDPVAGARRSPVATSEVPSLRRKSLGVKESPSPIFHALRWSCWQRAAPLLTWAVALAVYGGWFYLTAYHHELPVWVVVLAGGWAIAWQGSIQHETIHGNPSRQRWVNAAIGMWPLSLWLPYDAYRESHLTHHRDDRLTDPHADPESFYVLLDHWKRMNGFARVLRQVNQTLVGRLLFGPAMAMLGFWGSELASMWTGDSATRRRLICRWSVHIALTSLLGVWLFDVCEIPFWQYGLCYVYPGLSLTLLRSFTEHRPTPAILERSVIVEAELPLALLFLNNNLHAVHHRFPRLPWYRVPGVYRSLRAQILGDNGAFYFKGYRDVVRRFAWRRKDHPVWQYAVDDSMRPTAQSADAALHAGSVGAKNHAGKNGVPSN